MSTRRRFAAMLMTLIGLAAAQASDARTEMLRSNEEVWLELDAVVVTAPIRDGFTFRGIGGVTIQTVAVDDVIYGPIERGSTTLTIGTDEFDRPWFRLETGKRYLVELTPPDPETGRRTAVAAHDAEPRRVARYRDWFDRLPPWSEPIDGISIRAVPSRYVFDADDELGLILAFKNVSSRRRLLRVGTSPLLAHVELDVEGPDGRPFEAVETPHTTREASEAHFAAHGRDQSTPLDPGEISTFFLQRLNSAKPGWGFKERFGFRYYPLTEPGRYTIRVRAIGFRNQPLIAAPFTIDLRR